MPLERHWRDLDRATARSAPDAYGVIEFGDEAGVVSIATGVIRDEVKEAVAYGDATRVRWERTHGRDRAADLAATHRDRLG
ncbi:hypothetical protein BRD17_06960 [Halobacteriales archaeon SW_7_68_16]|nr:MAG: hypothetical protein BRD17_06960 [Halobacteriales archaeon SW_7_68_16]